MERSLVDVAASVQRKSAGRGNSKAAFLGGFATCLVLLSLFSAYKYHARLAGTFGKAGPEAMAELMASNKPSEKPEEEEWNDPMCQLEKNTEYDGERVVQWGEQNIKDNPGDCCSSCSVNPDCNVWVWCSQKSGCGTGHQFGECWLKQASPKLIVRQKGTSGDINVGWWSGAVFADRATSAVIQEEERRLQSVREDANNPLVFLNITMKGKKLGRVLISLFGKTSPRAAENFRQLCTGEAGMVPEGRQGYGLGYSLKGTAFYRIIDKFICQGGSNTDSVYGGAFKDDPGGLALKHDRPGLLSMANSGPDSNTSHFSIIMAPAAHLDGHYVIFGEVVEGLDILKKINALAAGKPNNEVGLEQEVIISDAGQLSGPQHLIL